MDQNPWGVDGAGVTRCNGLGLQAQHGVMAIAGHSSGSDVVLTPSLLGLSTRSLISA